MVDVFISYSRDDEARAQDLARRFEAVGLKAWWDRKIPPGKTWDQVIGKAESGEAEQDGAPKTVRLEINGRAVRSIEAVDEEPEEEEAVQ